MIKNLNTRVQIDRRGKIRIGGKSEKGYPVSYDYFDLKAFPELQKVYGDKQNSLRVMFPSDDLNDVATNDYRLYNSKRLVRKCDGVECVHIMENNGHQAGEITGCICQPNMKDACTPYMMLKVFVLNYEDKIVNPYAYALVTGSINSIRDIISSLEQMLNPETGYGTLKGLVFELTVKKVSGTGKSLFPILSLQLVKSTKKLAERAI